MSFSKDRFDKAAKNLLGAVMYDNLTVKSDFNRADLCREIAQRTFINDLTPDHPLEFDTDLSIVQFVAKNLWAGDGCTGLSD